jgi:hypothetical protein
VIERVETGHACCHCTERLAFYFRHSWRELHEIIGLIGAELRHGCRTEQSPTGSQLESEPRSQRT